MFPEVVTTDESSDTLFYRPKRSGTGATIPGIRSKFFGLLDVSLEYRAIKGSYVPQFFDQSYDLNRVVSVSQGTNTTIKTKDMSIFSGYDDNWTSNGLFGSASMIIFNLLNFNALIDCSSTSSYILMFKKKLRDRMVFCKHWL